MKSPVIVFDLDDTLISEHDFVKSGFQYLDQWLVENYNLRGFFEVAFKLFHQNFRGTIFNEAFKELKHPLDESLLNELVHLYRTHPLDLKLLPDAVKTITTLASLKIPMALISDGPLDAQRNKIDHLNLVKTMKPIILTGMWGKEYFKPNPRAYLEIEKYFGSEHQFYYIGDNALKDFITPNQRSWISVQIVRNSGEYANKKATVLDAMPTHHIHDLTELLKILKL